MARTRPKRWSYSTGERGRNRVRAFEHPTGVLMVEFNDKGKRTRFSLGHTDRKRAKQQADLAAAKLGKAESLRPELPRSPTLGVLFDNYQVEVTPKNGQRHQKYDRRASLMFLRYFGSERLAQTLSLQDWERFGRDRASGRVGPGTGPWKPAGGRTVQKDLSFLRSVLNWATVAGDGQGGVLLQRNPLKGFKLPKEKNPLRVTLSAEDYEALLSVAMQVDWRFYVALVLAHETGHRIGAIRELRWSDIDFTEQSVTWREDTEKTGYEHTTPLTGKAVAALEQARARNPAIGESPVLPAPKDASRPVSRYMTRDWWRAAVRLAGLEPVRGRGWHSIRRKFATDLIDLPLKVVCQLGGWRDHDTLLSCYQRPDETAMRAALEARSQDSGVA